MQSIGVIGGDLRQVSLAKDFLRDGYDVYIYGLKGLGETDDARAFCTDIIILPVPLSAKEYLNMPFSDENMTLEDVFDKIPKGRIVFGGNFTPWAQSKLSAKGIKYFDILKRPEFGVYNASPTAEGAIEIAIAETPFTIRDSSVLITGYGNISKALEGILTAMGAKIDFAIRDRKQAAEADCHGHTVYHPQNIYNHIEKYDIIFNTVPAVLFEKPSLEKIKKDSIIIDLASRPGGVDFDSAKELSTRVIWALSLPGKTAPVSAGAIIKKTIENILAEEGFIC